MKLNGKRIIHVQFHVRASFFLLSYNYPSIFLRTTVQTRLQDSPWIFLFSFASPGNNYLFGESLQSEAWSSCSLLDPPFPSCLPPRYHLPLARSRQLRWSLIPREVLQSSTATATATFALALARSFPRLGIPPCFADHAEHSKTRPTLELCPESF